MVIPTKLGGTGLDAVTNLVILEELAAADAGYATTWHVNNIALTVLFNMGSDEQVERFVKPILEGSGGVASLSTTEPDGGATSALLIEPLKFVFKTTAHLDGDEWVINGAKMFCSNAGLPFAKWALVFCRTDMDQTGWGSTKPIMVPLDTPGVALTTEEDKMGQRLSNTQSLTFDDVRVPKDFAVGVGGRPIAGGTRRTTSEPDAAIAAISVGCARPAYEEALAWAKQRVVLGKPIIQYQLIQAKIDASIVENRKRA
jgi:alkylation response protein AidB-like acyl-CoA dehydrogenase